MKTLLLLISLCFYIAPFATPQELKILYVPAENPSESMVPIYSEGQYNKIFQSSSESSAESSPYSKLLFSSCQESPFFVIPTQEKTSRLIIRNQEKNMTLAIKVILDLEKQKIMNPKMNFSEESLIVSSGGKLEINVTYGCQSLAADDPSDPWSLVFFDLKAFPQEEESLNSSLNLNQTKNFNFSVLKFCEAPKKSYWSLIFLMSAAIATVFFSTKQPPIVTDSPETQQIQPIHAFLFVIFGSFLLTILYFFLPYLVTLLFLMVILSGLSSLSLFFSMLFEKFGPPSFNQYLGRVPFYGLMKAHEFLSILIAVIISILYVLTKNWILNNMIGVSFVFLLIRTIRMPNYFVALLMLGFAFVYDIFWVFYSSHIFGRSVMAYVATNLNLPLKIICPTMIDSPLNTCSLLGLGDMALPGFFIAFCYYIDRLKNTKVYHKTSILAYIFALVFCLIALVFFHSAQPALLYISPSLLISVAFMGWCRGEMKELWLGIVEQKFEPNKKKRIDRILMVANGKDKDESLEHDKEEHYYATVDNTLFEMRKDEP